MPSADDGPIDAVIDEMWDQRARISPDDEKAQLQIIEALDLLDQGVARVASIDPETDRVVVTERARRAILLAFSFLRLQESAAGPFRYHDRLPLKQRFERVRAVPGAIARFGSYLGPGSVLMPSFVNVGAYVGPGTLVDTWATVGSCAQVGSNVHLSGGVGIGGVLEPVGALPVIVEDEAFVGSRAVIVEGARVRTGAKLGAGALLTGSTRVFDAGTGEELASGEAPEWSVCVTSTRTHHFPGGDFGTPCLLVLRRLAEGETLDKTRLSSIFREHGAAS